MDYKVYENERGPYDDQYQIPDHFQKVFDYHRSLKDYQVTPLYDLKGFADRYHLKKVYVKDESLRFHLNAFKGLGVSYAASQFKGENLTFVTCTDGNHGKAVAWYCATHQHHAIIFMPQGSEERRVKAIEKWHAKVIVTDLNYDDTVRYACEYAKEHGYCLIQDTALSDDDEAVKNIILGYATLIKEAIDQMTDKPTHVFLQAGVGSFAGGAIWYLSHLYDEMPYIGIIESSSCPCIYESIKRNDYYKVSGHPQTIMAGLNCGEANYMTLPMIKAYAKWLIQCDDQITIKGMDRAKHPILDDPSYSAGESGAVSLGFLEEILQNQCDEQFKLNEDSVVLLINTEGECQDE